MSSSQTRKEHLEGAKKRALEHIEEGNLNNCWASFVSDLSKHEETRDHAALELGTIMLAGGHLSTKESLEKFINDFQ